MSIQAATILSLLALAIVPASGMDLAAGVAPAAPVVLATSHAPGIIPIPPYRPGTARIVPIPPTWAWMNAGRPGVGTWWELRQRGIRVTPGPSR